MVSWTECHQQMDAEFLLVDELKAEKNYPFQMKLAIRNNF